MVYKRVALWSAPRCLSTAFERSITTLGKVKVLHEPYAKAYYFGPERRSPRFDTKPIDPDASYGNISEMILRDYEGVDVLFFKDMAYDVENRMEMFAEDRFKDLKHSFLIRNPAKSISSLYRISTSQNALGWDYFDVNEAGVRQVYELYEFISKYVDPDPVVVDADDLQDNPDEIMKVYCDAVGIKYKAHMTSWERGLAPQVQGIWSYGWHETLRESKGILPRDKKPVSSEALKELPPEVVKFIEDSKPYYELLRAKRI